MTIRIILCVDVDTDSVEEAYQEVLDEMHKVELSWESSDEWYDNEKLGDPAVLQAACAKVWDKKDGEENRNEH